jgi:CheY-like chemotaxis protein
MNVCYIYQDVKLLLPLKTRFLLADDDSDDAHLFCEALSQIAPVMECCTVENGKELFRFLQARNPDVIFLDINMPS